MAESSHMVMKQRNNWRYHCSVMYVIQQW